MGLFNRKNLTTSSLIHKWFILHAFSVRCSVEGKTQGADFSDCVSESVVTDFGVGYDIKSVMHYQPFL